MRGCWLVLAKTPKLTVSEIAKAIKEDFDQVVDQKSVTNALQKKLSPLFSRYLRTSKIIRTRRYFGMPASISFTAAIAALSFSGSRERTTRLVFGFLSSSMNG